MRLVEAKRDGDLLRLCFVDGDLAVRKLILASLEGKQREGLRFTLLKACREAGRDIAYAKYGDKWVEHDPRDFWSENATQEERAMLKDALNGG